MKEGIEARVALESSFGNDFDAPDEGNRMRLRRATDFECSSEDKSHTTGTKAEYVLSEVWSHSVGIKNALLAGACLALGCGSTVDANRAADADPNPGANPTAGTPADADASALVDYTLGPSSQKDERGQGNWSCLGYQRPPPASTPANSVTYLLPVVDALSVAPVERLTVQECSTKDTACAAPLSRLQPPDDRASADVLVELTPALGLQGFFRIGSAGGGTEPYVPESYYLGNIPYQDRRVPPIRLFRAQTLRRVLQNIGVSAELSQAQLDLRAFDCDDEQALGVHFSISPSSGVAYTLLDGASLEALVGFGNVSPGVVSVDAFVDGTNDRINPTTVSFPVLGAQLTTIELHAVPFYVAPIGG